MTLSYHCLLFGLLHYRAVPGLQTPLSLLIAISFCNRDTLPMIYLTKLQKTSTKGPHLSLSYFSQFLSLKSNQNSVNSGRNVTSVNWWDLGNIFFRYWLMIHSFHCSQIVLSWSVTFLWQPIPEEIQESSPAAKVTFFLNQYDPTCLHCLLSLISSNALDEMTELKSRCDQVFSRKNQ